MFATVKAPFYDIRAHVNRKVGDRFELTEERAKEIKSVSADLIIVEEDKPSVKKTQRSKKEDA